MYYKLPDRVKSNSLGFDSLTLLFHKINKITGHAINLDFVNCKLFEANLCAVLGAICDHVFNNGNSVSFTNLSPHIETVFSKNGFLNYLDSDSDKNDVHETIIQYQKFKSSDHIEFTKYLDTKLLTRQDMPQMSHLLQRKINESIHEIFENAVTHGDCDYVYSCGQCYPDVDPPKIDFTIVDLGNTIKLNVNEFLKSEKNGTETIKWAVDEMNTTKIGNTPGGLGLKLIREFMAANNGKIQIISADGFWQQEKKNIFVQEYSMSFPGTIVNLEFNIEDTSYYYLVDEKAQLNEGDIF